MSDRRISIFPSRSSPPPNRRYSKRQVTKREFVIQLWDSGASKRTTRKTRTDENVPETTGAVATKDVPPPSSRAKRAPRSRHDQMQLERITPERQEEEEGGSGDEERMEDVPVDESENASHQGQLEDIQEDEELSSAEQSGAARRVTLSKPGSSGQPRRKQTAPRDLGQPGEEEATRLRGSGEGRAQRKGRQLQKETPPQTGSETSDSGKPSTLRKSRQQTRSALKEKNLRGSLSTNLNPETSVEIYTEEEELQKNDQGTGHSSHSAERVSVHKKQMPQSSIEQEATLLQEEEEHAGSGRTRRGNQQRRGKTDLEADESVFSSSRQRSAPRDAQLDDQTSLEKGDSRARSSIKKQGKGKTGALVRTSPAQKQLPSDPLRTTSSRKQKQEEASARKKQEEAIARKQKLEEASVRKQKQEEASSRKQKQEEAIARKQKLEEASSRKQKQEEASSRKQKQEEAIARKQKREEASARKKQEEASLRKQKQEEAIARKQKQEEASARKKQEEAIAKKQKLEEASLRQQKQEEASLRQQKQEEASARKQKQEEASLRQQKQEEAIAKKQKQEEAIARKQKQEEASLRQQKQEEASLRQQKLEEASLRQQKQEEASLRQQKQEEASLRQQKQEEASLRQQKLEEASLRQQKQEEASLRKQKQEEASSRKRRHQEKVSLQVETSSMEGVPVKRTRGGLHEETGAVRDVTDRSKHVALGQKTSRSSQKSPAWDSESEEDAEMPDARERSPESEREEGRAASSRKRKSPSDASGETTRDGSYQMPFPRSGRTPMQTAEADEEEAVGQNENFVAGSARGRRCEMPSQQGTDNLSGVPEGSEEELDRSVSPGRKRAIRSQDKEQHSTSDGESTSSGRKSLGRRTKSSMGEKLQSRIAFDRGVMVLETSSRAKSRDTTQKSLQRTPHEATKSSSRKQRVLREIAPTHGMSGSFWEGGRQKTLGTESPDRSLQSLEEQDVFSPAPSFLMAEASARKSKPQTKQRLPGPPSKPRKEAPAQSGRQVRLWSQAGLSRKSTDVIDLDIDLEILNSLEDSLLEKDFPRHCVQASTKFFSVLRKELQTAIAGVQNVKEVEKKVKTMKTDIKDFQAELHDTEGRELRLLREVEQLRRGQGSRDWQVLELSDWMLQLEELADRWCQYRSSKAASRDTQKLALVGEPELLEVAGSLLGQ